MSDRELNDIRKQAILDMLKSLNSNYQAILGGKVYLREDGITRYAEELTQE